MSRTEIITLALAAYKETETGKKAIEVLGEETTETVYKQDLTWEPSVGRWNDSMAIRWASIKVLEGKDLTRALADDMYMAAGRCADAIEKIAKVEKLASKCVWHGKREKWAAASWENTREQLLDLVKAMYEMLPTLYDNWELSTIYYDAENLFETTKKEAKKGA